MTRARFLFQILNRKREAVVDDPAHLKKLAVWYRDFADRAGNPMIWEARLRTAQDLDQEAERVERLLASRKRPNGCQREVQYRNCIQYDQESRETMQALRYRERDAGANSRTGCVRPRTE